MLVTSIKMGAMRDWQKEHATEMIPFL